MSVHSASHTEILTLPPTLASNRTKSADLRGKKENLLWSLCLCGKKENPPCSLCLCGKTKGLCVLCASVADAS